MQHYLRSVCLFLMLLLSTISYGATSERPNLIFVLVDDLRFDGMGFVNPALRTPHIDELAAGGMYLPNAVVTTSLCSPSRATILTGLSTRNHGIVDNNDASEEHLTFFPAYLQEAGYATAFIGKWHMGRADDNPRPGFDHWVSFKGQGFYNSTDRIPPELVTQGVRHQLNVNGQSVDQRGYMTDELNEYALTWLDEREAGEPFFLYLSHKAVHSDATPAPRHAGLYDGVDFDLPDSAADTDEGGAGKPMWVHNQRNSWHGIEFAYHGTDPFADYIKQYYATLSAVDDGIGAMMALLERKKLLRNTVIVFMSDNGFLFGDHGLIDKRNAYEPSVRVPLVFYGPEFVQPGSVNRARVRNLDIAPTFVEFAGGEQPDQFEGRSLLPVLQGADALDDWKDPDFIYEYYWEWTFPQTPTTFAITRDEIKYIQYHGIWDLEELYDLNKDPHERHNLINDDAYRNALIDRRSALYAALKNSNGAHVVPYTERRAEGLAKRSANGSRAAEFPPSFVRKPGAKDLFEGFMPPPRLE